MNPRGAHWYHGGPTAIRTVDPARIGQGNDQYGPGFYVTTDERTALAYARRSGAGFVHEVAIPDFQPLNLGKPLSKSAITGVLRRSPRLEEILWNFADIKSDGRKKALQMAVGTYAKLDPIAAINAMANDFFDGGRAPFCDALADSTGKTGVAIATGDALHAAIWRAEAIEVLRCTQIMSA